MTRLISDIKIKVTEKSLEKFQKKASVVLFFTTSDFEDLLSTGDRKNTYFSFLDKPVKKQCLEILRNSIFKAGFAELFVIPYLSSQKSPAIIIAGLGDFETVGPDAAFRKAGQKLRNEIIKYGIAHAHIHPSSPQLTKQNLHHFYEGFQISNYTFDRYKSSDTPEKATSLSFHVYKNERVAVEEQDFAMIDSLVDGTVIARDLMNLAPRDCTPNDIVTKCRLLANECGLGVKVYSEPQLEKMKAGALLAVGAGSDEETYLVKLVHRRTKRTGNKKVIALVGKGITFDSGGLSLKPSSGMERMKFDMGGAAAVIGAMAAISKVNPDIEVRAYIPTAENMPDGAAVKPGDVIRSFNGKTIEVLNTDAEGRLILADALAFAEHEGADIIVDIATLTGAIIVALGAQYAGLFSDDDELSQLIVSAGKESGEKFWRLPLAREYKNLIKSDFADIKNVAVGREGGSINAALFLSEFVKTKKWVHLDIASTMQAGSHSPELFQGAAGFGVRTLTRFVQAIDRQSSE